MNQEMKDLLTLVKNSNKSAEEVVHEYMNAIGWSLLKDELQKMSSDEKSALYRKLTVLREPTHRVTVAVV